MEVIYLHLHRSWWGRILIRVLQPRNSFIPLTVQIHKSNEPLRKALRMSQDPFISEMSSLYLKGAKVDNVTCTICHAFANALHYNDLIFRRVTVVCLFKSLSGVYSSILNGTFQQLLSHQSWVFLLTLHSGSQQYLSNWSLSVSNYPLWLFSVASKPPILGLFTNSFWCFSLASEPLILLFLLTLCGIWATNPWWFKQPLAFLNSIWSINYHFFTDPWRDFLALLELSIPGDFRDP